MCMNNSNIIVQRKYTEKEDGQSYVRSDVKVNRIISTRELLRRIGERRGIHLDELSMRVASTQLFACILDELKDGNKVVIDDFGTFGLRFIDNHLTISFLPARRIVKELSIIKYKVEMKVLNK